jgi:hypothetical protein
MSYSVSKNCTAANLLAYNAGTNRSRYYRNYITTQNIKVVTPNLYSFTLNASQIHDPFFDGTPLFDRAALYMDIKTTDGITVLSDYVWSDGAGTKRVAGFLNCGNYIVSCSVSSEIEFTGNLPCLHIFGSSASYTSDLPGVTGFTQDCNYTKPMAANDSMFNSVFALKHEKKMEFSAWLKQDCGTPCDSIDFGMSNIQVWANGSALSDSFTSIRRTGAIIDGWQKIEGEFTVPSGRTSVALHFINSNPAASMYVDDIRIHPFNANMKSYVFDPRTLRLSAELDENNYASIYEYDEEGQLIRVKKETSQGVKTINETRSAKQRLINDVVQ